jgi:DNA-binding MarR family transcriptional regulator
MAVMEMETEPNPTAQKLMQAFSQLRRMHWRQPPAGGLTGSELMVLFRIKEAATTADTGIKVSELSNLLRVATPTITQQIHSLTAQGLVEKSSDPDDRRAVRIRLTAQGEYTLKHATGALLAKMTGLAEYLGEEEGNELARLLSKASTYLHGESQEK